MNYVNSGLGLGYTPDGHNVKIFGKNAPLRAYMAKLSSPPRAEEPIGTSNQGRETQEHLADVHHHGDHMGHLPATLPRPTRSHPTWHMLHWCTASSEYFSRSSGTDPLWDPRFAKAKAPLVPPPATPVLALHQSNNRLCLHQ